ncbi:uncharacterized protein SEPMUDRAFT_146785 [Sphaerulina musiva SO2202]|uniref:Uncharacterized protein n=1 Tax=Sphaerulina musiva (strain SO2202) TaxID=692275 RepID=N1QNL7_SPHMS|nr:uncharacterized protein SEPMUDRAFT_146785 [Sphaerulina musiva SO2202]EMF17868.1 hypothetical protein SEPMUDRAFT_146785 [Sphaerulina musiva SO2202]
MAANHLVAVNIASCLRTSATCEFARWAAMREMSTRTDFMMVLSAPALLYMDQR